MSALKAHTVDNTANITKTERNPLANIWLAVLTLVLALFATCTLVLVAWPVLAWLGSVLRG